MKTSFLLPLLFSFYSGTVAVSFKEACLDLRNAVTKSTYLDGSCLVAHLEPKLGQPAAFHRCSDLHPEGQLAYTFDQKHIDGISALIDLSNGLWTSLIMDSENQTISLNRTNSSDANPSWATGFPDPARGSGIMLRYDGLVNAQPDSVHPFLCEFFDSPAAMHFKSLGRNSKASNFLFSKSTETDMHDCGIRCSQDPKCRSYAYSASTGQCEIFWLYGDALTLQSDGDFQTMTRLRTEQSCLEATECVNHLEAPKILLFGGSTKSIESYYMFDSSRNSIVANLTSLLKGHVAVLMSDGRVLIAGGTITDHTSPLKSTTIFDPRTNSFTPSADMTVPRWHLEGTQLQGVVLVCGGFDGAASVNSCEQYSDGLWSAIAPMPQTRHSFTLLNLGDKVYAAGGFPSPGTALTRVDRYDPSSDSWDTVAPLPTTKYNHMAAVLLDQMYVCGFDALCYKYDPLADAWSGIASTLVGHYGAAMVAFGGRLYCMAGDGTGSTPLRSVEVYNPETDQWTNAADLIETREYHAVVVL